MRSSYDILVIVRDEFYFIDKVFMYEVKSSEREIEKIDIDKIKETVGDINDVEFHALIVRPNLIENKIKFKQYRVR